MIDLTKALPKPIRREFLENVLDGIDKTKQVDDLDINDMSLSELERMLGNLDKESDGISQNFLSDVADIRFDGNRARNDEGLGVKNNWWAVDARGNSITPDFEEGDQFKKILKSPYFLVKYVTKSIQRNKIDSVEDWPPFLNMVFQCFGAVGVFSAILMINDLNFIVSAQQLAIISIIISISAKIIEQVMIGKTSNSYEDEISEIEQSYLGNDIADSIEFVSNDEDDDDIYIGNDIDYGDDDYIYDDYEGNENDEGRKMAQAKKAYGESLKLKENVIPPRIKLEDFNERLLEAFNRNARFRTQTLLTREDTVLSLNEYILCNNPGFSELKSIPKGSMVYNNINWLIYEGLRGIYTQLTYTGEYIMEVQSVTESQLYYKLEVVLPKAVKLDKLVKDLSVLESKFKAHESDVEVDINITSYGNTFVFRVKKESSTVVTWGDAIRYYDPVTDTKTYEEFMNERKYTFPVLAGLHNEETPIIFDLAKNTSIAVAGTSGSGKSWAVYSLLYNMLIQSHPGDVSFVILDFKRDTQYRTIARLPHVVGYHHEIDKYNDYLREVVLELNRRKEIMDAIGVSKWDQLRANFKDDPEKLHKFPWLFVVIEETAAVLSSLETSSKKTELKDEFIRLLKEVAKQGRSLGMRIIMISQRTTSAELPRDIESECGVKFTFKLKDADLERVEMLPSGVVAPKRKGIAVFKEEYLTEPIVIKALGIGGMDDDQILNLTRMLAFEWHLRVTDEEQVSNFPTFKITDNRRVRRDEVMRDLEEKKYFFDISKLDIEDIISKIDGVAPPKKKEVVIKPKPEIIMEPNNWLIEDDEEDTDYTEYATDFENDATLDLSDKLIDIDELLSKYATYEEPVKEEVDETEYVEAVKKPLVEEQNTVNDIKTETVSKPKKNTQIKGMMGTGMVKNKSSDNKSSQKKPDNKVEPLKQEPQTRTIDKPQAQVIQQPVGMKKARNIIEFIRTNGEATAGAHKMRHDELRRYYSEDDINNALNNIDIVDLDGYYLA